MQYVARFYLQANFLERAEWKDQAEVIMNLERFQHVELLDSGRDFSWWVAGEEEAVLLLI